ncbi:MAG TPA: sugar-binding protein [Aggregatilineaceae bacterium]|nr:sugar-binding protein [Aggregatilineaceae bacterium]
MKNGLRLITVLTLAVMALSPLVGSGVSAPVKAQDDTFTIAWIPKALNNPVFELGRDGCMAAAAQLGAEVGQTVECLYMGSVNSDMAEQARIIEDAISQGVDAIGVSCNDPDGCVDPINAAIAAGIPTMTWDSDSPDSGRFTYLGVDNYTGGWAAGELLVKAMGEEGKVALLTGVPGAFNLEERIRGFKDYVAQYPGIEIVATVACNDDINLGVQVVEETMLANPDLNGWFFVGLWPVFAGRGAMPQFEQAVLNNNMKAVAFDTLPVELEWVQDGLLHGLVGQKYWGWGYDTVFMALNHATNLYPYPDWTDSGMDIVTINNVDAMAEAWATSDFTQPLPAAYPPEDGKFSIAWIPKALNNPVFELGRDGCMAAAAQLGAEVGQTVECLYMGSVNSDMAEQARIIEDAISQGVDAIGVSCNDPDGCVDPINAAIAAGIPTMTWDSDSPDSGRFTYLGVDNYTGGWAAGELLVKAMGEEGKVALLTGVPGAFNLEERIRGFKDYVAQYPGIEIVATVACNDDINLGVQVVEETMLANPDLNGWFFVGLWPVFAGRGAMPQFEQAVLNNNMKAVAFDTLPVELEWVQDGLLHGLVGQKYWGWGYDTVFMALNHATNLYPYPDWTDSGMDIVTINNVDAMAEAWATSDFTQPLPPAFP